jgi:hypothetical protein
VLTATPQLRIQRVQRIGVECPDLDIADERGDVLAHVAPVLIAGARLPIEMLVQVPLEQLVDRGARAEIAAIVDLVQQPGQNLLGLPLGRRPIRHRLPEVVTAFRHWVEACVDLDSQGSAGQLLHRPACALATRIRPRHGSSVRPVRTTNGAMTARLTIGDLPKLLVKRGGRSRVRTCDPLLVRELDAVDTHRDLRL